MRFRQGKRARTRWGEWNPGDKGKIKAKRGGKFTPTFELYCRFSFSIEEKNKKRAASRRDGKKEGDLEENVP